MKPMKSYNAYFYACLLLSLVTLVTISSCDRNNNLADAYGNFEADEITVSAQSQGELMYLNLNEGDKLKKDQLVGMVDTAGVIIKRSQLYAQQNVLNARLNNLEAQLKVQEDQRVNMIRELNRVEKLLIDKAATQQQYDDIKGNLDVLNSQAEALNSQKNIIYGERSVLAAQIKDVNNLLDKCRIVNPIEGTVLEKYVESGELVSPGKSIYKIADIEQMELKIYISGSQLSTIAIGDSVSVAIDRGRKEMQTLPGKISWISSQVEFTPKIIQTRQERVNMVYAVKVRVRNDGSLKIGMPGEVTFRKKTHKIIH
jgi:HlyD family secretion protein